MDDWLYRYPSQQLIAILDASWCLYWCRRTFDIKYSITIIITYVCLLLCFQCVPILFSGYSISFKVSFSSFHQHGYNWTGYLGGVCEIDTIFFLFKTNKKQPLDSHEWTQQYHTQFDCDKPGFLHVHKPTHGRPRLKKPQGVRRLTLPTIGLGEWQVRKNLKLLRMTLGCGLKFQDDAKSVTSKATNVMQILVKLGGVYKGTFCQIMKQVYIFMCAINIWIY